MDTPELTINKSIKQKKMLASGKEYQMCLYSNEI